VRGALTAEEIAAFDRQGSLLCGQVLEPDEVAALRAAFARLFRGEYDLGVAPDTVAWRPGGDPLVTHYMPGHTRYRAAYRHGHDHLIDVPDGGILQGPHFPVVYRC